MFTIGHSPVLHSKKRVVCDLAVRIMLLSACISIAFGSTIRLALPAVAPILALVGSDCPPSNIPAEEAPLQEEVPAENQGSTGLPKENVAPCGSNDLKRSKRYRDRSIQCGIQLLNSAASHFERRGADRSFEHGFRNGIGAPLRC